ncbi:transposase [bacterium]|nr:transposase [bacterium]
MAAIAPGGRMAAEATMRSRRTPAHPSPIERIGRPVILLVTVCTDRRRPLLANHEAAAILCDAWRRAASWAVGRYVLMPDHVHLFCAPRDDVAVVAWVRFWKAMATRRWRADVARPLWQRDCWDTQLRSDAGYDEKWRYVRWNPVRHGLVEHPARWPFQGEMTSLEWW